MLKKGYSINTQVSTPVVSNNDKFNAIVFGSDFDPHGSDVFVDEFRLFFASTTVREKVNTNPLDWCKINAVRLLSIA